MKEEKVYFQNSKNQKLCGILYLPDKKGSFPVVIVCHGLSTSKESRNTTMTYPELIKNGIAVFAFDFSGHGKSEGKFENITISQAIDDLKSALNYIENKDFIDKKKIGLLGSSFGGITSIFVAAKDKRIKVLALKSPVTDFKYSAYKRKDIKQWKEEGYIMYHSAYQGNIKLNYSYYSDGIKYNAIKIAKRIKIPTLVVVGDKDITVFSAKVKEFFLQYKLLLIYHCIFLCFCLSKLFLYPKELVGFYLHQQELFL
jgi:cephalosporin-C deacetylase-like acetyl esterase